MPTKSDNTGGRGGRRPGAGRKKTAVKEKYENGNPGGRKLEVLDIPDTEGEDMPEPHEFLSARQHDGSTLEAADIYRETWEWLDKLGVAKAVSPQLLERYAMCSARWIQCEEMTTRLGYLSKHPTTGKPIPSPFINIGINYMNQANRLWDEIFQIVKENCSTEYGGANPQDDVMERLLRARKGMSMNTQRLEQVPIDKLVPYVRNARTHSKEQIAQLRSSLREFGFVSPAVIDNNYNLLVGHGRIAAAREEGYKTVPCVFAEDLTDAQKRAYILADNQLALNAGWDEEMLSVELSDLQENAFDLPLLGFDDKELEKLLNGDADKDIEDDDFDLCATLEKASFVEHGDIWTVGRHRLLCGDATSAEDVDTLMDGKRANLVLTDPPYSVSFKASDGLTIQNDSLKGEEFYNFLLSAFKNMADHLEKSGAAYCFHADTEGLTFRRAFVDAGFHLAGVCIWVKNSLVLGRSDYQWQHEPVLYGFLQNGKHPWYAGRAETTIWNFDKPKRNKDHPTSKPLDLLGYPIQNSTQENAIVIDTFGGSGSTLMACEQLNRACYMCELDLKCASVILHHRRLRLIESIHLPQTV